MRSLIYLFIALSLSFCSEAKKEEKAKFPFASENPKILQPEGFAMDSKPVLIKGARIMTAAGKIYESASLLMQDGLIAEISEQDIIPPENTTVIDGQGMTITPGIIDVHSHMGVYPWPELDAHEDGNEMVRPNTADVWAEHGFWPQDPALWRAMQGGVTTIQALPGSGNLIGGRSFTAKLIPHVAPRQMRFPEARQGLKMACGENPKRVYKDKSIMTRMGNAAAFRKAFQDALEYRREWAAWEKKKDGKPPKRDFVSETLMKVLKGEIFVNLHCYRADDISNVLDVAKEFGFKIRTVHHGLEAYKVAERLAEEGVATATWADWWGFKAEAYDGIPYNAALLQKAGAKAIIHSDSSTDVQFLNLEAGKAMAAGLKLGINITEDQALAWVTKNAAWALGLQDKIGTLEKGKMADIVVWDGHPFSIYTKSQLIFINGEKVFDRSNKLRMRSDFEVGFNDMAFYDGRDFNTPPEHQQILWPQEPLKVDPTVSDRFYIENTQAFVEGQWHKNISLLVEGGKIAAINPQEKPDNVTVVDGKGQFLTPGLIQSESALGLVEISLDHEAQDIQRSSSPTPAYETFDALNTENIRVAINRSEGILTSITNFNGPIASGFATAWDMIPGGIINKKVSQHGNLNKRAFEGSRASLWYDAKELIGDVLFYKNNKASYLKGQSKPLSTSQLHLEAMLPVVNGTMPWVLQVSKAEDIGHLMGALKNKELNNAKPVIAGGAESWLRADELKQMNIPVIVAPGDQMPNNFEKTRARFDLAAYLTHKGVPVIINDSADLGTGRLRQEAGFAVKYGMKHEEAVKAITETPGKVFNIKRGSIEKGADANFVLWTSDPLEPTSWARRIWIQGKEQSLWTRQRGLAEKYLKD